MLLSLLKNTNSKRSAEIVGEMYHSGVISPQCATQSVGAANQLFTSLVQTILTVQCSISSPDMWPTDYGKTLFKQGKRSLNATDILFGEKKLAKNPLEMNYFK